MKKVLFFIAICCTLTANAQNYFISFTGTGSSTTVNTIKVENLTAGTSLSLNENDILHLTGTTDIKSLENKQSSILKVYPNPTTGNSILQIYPPCAGNAVITVFDMTGKKVIQIQNYFENSLQEFRLSGINTGFYLINVRGSNYQYSEKLLCNGKADGTITIEKISNNQVNDEKISKTDYKGVQVTVEMAYTPGDRLKFTGISGNYSTVKIDIPTSDKIITFNFIACTDGANINYPVVEIGMQIWMEENLKTTKYSNSDLIGTTDPATKDITAESTPKYQWVYDGNESNVVTYGRLYTWYTVTDSRNVCPIGWHVPSDAEWTTLTDYLTNNGYGYGGSGSNIAKSMAATSGWTIYSAAGTIGNDQVSNNSSGFTALQRGLRRFSGGFYGIGSSGHWWSSTEGGMSEAWSRLMSYNNNYVDRSNLSKQYGFSVRCLKDN